MRQTRELKTNRALQRRTGTGRVTLEREARAKTTGRAATASDGTARLELAAPVYGWVSARMVEAARETPEHVHELCRAIVLGLLN